ncbi:hypothetical protein [Roseivirga sp. UBA1976]|uniref:hypothetical protein n=1 Tax=Roseivirga sp. UBA1976 TaxID=1947386 RepID=UPI00257B0466|nr:hypothetical protein [Roseivirga sp. UBA1976]MEC7754539.1 hypothetical protein [Bacteroidota bacterium]|tara:strand:+ start:5134 stop:5394 length:261 start_codon:yes stop_codon:yes gene_type:complete
MGLDKEMDAFNPKRNPRYRIKGFLGRKQLAGLYGIGKDALTSSILEIECEIQKEIPQFKLNGKRNFTVREQELIFDLLGAPPGYEI